MIIRLKKYLFIGAERDFSEFFVRAQELGSIEFIAEGAKRAAPLPEEVKRLTDALKILRKQPVKVPHQKTESMEFALEIGARVLELKNEIDKLEEEKRFLDAEIARVAPLGNFSMDDLLYVQEKGRRVIQFFCMKASKRENVPKSKELIYVGTEYDLDYYISINKQRKSYPEMIEMFVDKTAKQLKDHQIFVIELLHQLQAELKGFAGYIPLLRNALLEQLEHHFLISTQKQSRFPIEDKVFTIEGWIPENKVENLHPLTENLAIYYEPILIEKEDRIPTHMENKGVSRVGEDLVRIYDIPSSNDRDPSLWVFWSFALFFSMIIADGGYGLIYLAIALFIKYKFRGLNATSQRLVKLFMILASSCFIWGLLTFSFFGISINPESALGKYSLMNVIAKKKADYHFEQKDEVYQLWIKKYPELARATSGEEMVLTKVQANGKEHYEMLEEFTDNFFLEFSLFVGVVHICLSLLRYLGRSWAHIGWVCFAIGGWLYFPAALHATSFLQFLGGVPKSVASTVGLQLVYFGLGLAVVLALIQKRWKGLGEIANILQVSADILSYLRLYALALASTIMAETFNQLGMEVGLAFGAILILAGHLVNITLGIVAGIIHGLRLNFIEWYHYSFEGGGKLFNPLRRLTKEKVTR